MISQIFLLSPRGDTIIFKDYKGNVPKVGARDVWVGMGEANAWHRC
jgi:hypothetical protein